MMNKYYFKELLKKAQNNELTKEEIENTKNFELDLQ